MDPLQQANEHMRRGLELFRIAAETLAEQWRNLGAPLFGQSFMGLPQLTPTQRKAITQAMRQGD